MCNQHIWLNSNPHCTIFRKHQQKKNCEGLGRYLWWLPGRSLHLARQFDRRSMLYLLETSALQFCFQVQAVPLLIQRGKLLKHDGAPAHYSVTFWMPYIVHDGSDVADLWLFLLAQPDLNFFFRGHVKTLAYETLVDSTKDVARIVVWVWCKFFTKQ